MTGRGLFGSLAAVGLVSGCGAAGSFCAGDESLDAAFAPRQGRGVLRYLPAKEGLYDPGEVTRDRVFTRFARSGVYLIFPFAHAGLRWRADRAHRMGFEMYAGAWWDVIDVEPGTEFGACVLIALGKSDLVLGVRAGLIASDLEEAGFVDQVPFVGLDLSKRLARSWQVTFGVVLQPSTRPPSWPPPLPVFPLARLSVGVVY